MQYIYIYNNVCQCMFTDNITCYVYLYVQSTETPKIDNMINLIKSLSSCQFSEFPLYYIYFIKILSGSRNIYMCLPRSLKNPLFNN